MSKSKKNAATLADKKKNNKKLLGRANTVENRK